MDVGSFIFRWILPFRYFWFLLPDNASLALSSKKKQKYQNGNIHQKLKASTLRKPALARRVGAEHDENLRKLTETRPRTLRGR